MNDKDNSLFARIYIGTWIHIPDGCRQYVIDHIACSSYTYRARTAHHSPLPVREHRAIRRPMGARCRLLSYRQLDSSMY